MQICRSGPTYISGDMIWRYGNLEPISSQNKEDKRSFVLVIQQFWSSFPMSAVVRTVPHTREIITEPYRHIDKYAPSRLGLHR